MIRLYLWFCRVFFVARGPWVRAGTRPSLRPLLISRAVRFNNSDISCRENADSYPLDRHAPLQAGHPVRRELSVKHERLWDTRPVIPDRVGNRRRAKTTERAAV